ncbi:MAG: hypothetical protein IH977_02350 [Nitrospinae bacterium]|nr:hypothetical protein [Nitrospinota bacterium]
MSPWGVYTRRLRQTSAVRGTAVEIGSTKTVPKALRGVNHANQGMTTAASRGAVDGAALAYAGAVTEPSGGLIERTVPDHGRRTKQEQQPNRVKSFR